MFGWAAACVILSSVGRVEMNDEVRTNSAIAVMRNCLATSPTSRMLSTPVL